MANIREYLQAILSARYGRDVRQSIHDAIDAINIQEEGHTSEIQGYIEDAEAWAKGTKDGTDVPSTDPTYHNNAKYYSQQAGTSATNADASATNADNRAKDAEAWAVGKRNNVDVPSTDPTYENNAKYWQAMANYWYLQAKAIAEGLSGALIPMGTVAFANLPSLASAEAGWMYNISDEFTTTSDFVEGAGHVIPLGANVYKTSQGKWDVLAGSPVTGVKGDSEQNYRQGNVNITKANIGLGNVPNTDFTSAINDLNTNKQDKLTDPLTQSDVKDNLTSTSTTTPLSANQGYIMSRDISWYGTSSTAASTIEKTATTSDGKFALTTGAKVSIKFTYNNGASAPTLNVDSTGAKSIKAYGTTAPTSWWQAGDVVTFTYDGTNWIMGATEGQISRIKNDLDYIGLSYLKSESKSVPSASAAEYTTVASQTGIATGTYIIIGQVSFQSSSNIGSRVVNLTDGNGNGLAKDVEVQGNQYGYTQLSISTILQAAENQTVNLNVRQHSGDSITTSGIIRMIRIK